jgi:hypothetical protein
METFWFVAVALMLTVYVVLDGFDLGAGIIHHRAHLPHARIVYDKFHVLRHVNNAVDETRRAEFFRKGGQARGLLRGKRWLLLRRWAHLAGRAPPRHRTAGAQPPPRQSLSAQRATRASLGLHLRRGRAPLPHDVASSPPAGSSLQGLASTISARRSSRSSSASTPTSSPPLVTGRSGTHETTRFAERRASTHRGDVGRQDPAHGHLGQPAGDLPYAQRRGS